MASIPRQPRPSATATLALTVLAMLAFAANSLLCRLALSAGHIDAASFTSVRVVSGATALALIVLPRWLRSGRARADPRAVVTLFIYMACFSFAYLTLTAATGALLLFGAVQVTMLGAALREGERFSLVSWIGLALAISGIVYLVMPGLSAPDPLGAILMTCAGIGWGFYSLRGRAQTRPLETTAANFLYTIPLALLVSLASTTMFHTSSRGLLLAVVSGAVTSGLGYVIWYAALDGLTAGHAAAVQLSVPVLAAVGAVIFLAEPMTLRLVLASLGTLGGIAIVLSQRRTMSSMTSGEERR